MLSRRKLIKKLSAVPVLGAFAGGVFPSETALAPAPKPSRDVIKELGLRTFINAAGNYTAMTASIMPDEVLDAIKVSSQEYVMLEEVQDKVGEKIAALVHAEAAMVTAGCWSALVLGTAGVLTGMDPKKVSQLPILAGTDMKSEVIVQKGHNTGYVHALTNTGVTIVEVETVEDVEKAINSKTAMMWYLNTASLLGKIQHEAWVAVGKKHNIPMMIDIAADVPPVENLWRFNELGFDLVCISGGKAMCGPQSAGILMGKKHLIAAARLSAPPRGGNIGRGMKVNKEEMIGMYVALERFINMDHVKERKMWDDRIAVIENKLKTISSVKTEMYLPPIANHVPALKISWDSSKIKMTRKDLANLLRTGSPSIETVPGIEDPSSIDITVFMLKPGQDKIVATRIFEELTKASA